MDPTVSDALADVVDLLGQHGVSTEDARPNIEAARAWELGLTLVAGAAADGLAGPRFAEIQQLAQAGPGDDRSVAMLWARGAAQLHRDWLRADEQRLEQRAEWEAFFGEFDVLLCPVAPLVAYPHEESTAVAGVLVAGERRDYYEQSLWPLMLDVSYLPYTVVPVVLSPAGLPVGIAVVAGAFQDRTAIEFAKLLADLAEPLGRPTALL